MSPRKAFMLTASVALASVLLPRPAASESADLYLNFPYPVVVRQDGFTGFSAFCGQGDGTDKFRVGLNLRLPEGAPLASALKLQLEVTSYGGPDEFETLDVFAVEGAVTPGVALYEDLGSGSSYGTTVVSRGPGAGGSVVTIELNETAVEEFNGLSRYSYPDYGISPGVFRVGLAIREPFTLPSGAEGVGLGPNDPSVIQQIVITPMTVPVGTSTWGKVKALYRAQR